MELTVLIFTAIIILIKIIHTQITSRNSKIGNGERNIQTPVSPPSAERNGMYPVLSNHASERMLERLDICGCEQYELMNKAFQYGKTADRTSGDLRITLESIKQRSDEDTVVKYYNNCIFIFSDDNVLKTVYKLNNSKYYH